MRRRNWLRILFGQHGNNIFAMLKIFARRCRLELLVADSQGPQQIALSTLRWDRYADAIDNVLCVVFQLFRVVEVPNC